MSLPNRRTATLLTIVATLALLFAPQAVSKQTSLWEANRGQSRGSATSTNSGVPRETAVTPTLDPALVPVCTCESGQGSGKPQQYDLVTGGVLHGKQNHHDIGTCQVNSDYHDAAATKMGLDIYTTAGNIAYSNWLYEHEGTTPWNWSKSCWAGK